MLHLTSSLASSVWSLSFLSHFLFAKGLLSVSIQEGTLDQDWGYILDLRYPKGCLSLHVISIYYLGSSLSVVIFIHFFNTVKSGFSFGIIFYKLEYCPQITLKFEKPIQVSHFTRIRGIVDLQCCISFCCTTVIQLYIHDYIHKSEVKFAQSCLTLCEPMNYTV